MNVDMKLEKRIKVKKMKQNEITFPSVNHPGHFLLALLLTKRSIAIATRGPGQTFSAELSSSFESTKTCIRGTNENFANFPFPEADRKFHLLM